MPNQRYHLSAIPFLGLVDNRFKLTSFEGGQSYQLYDFIANPGETNGLAGQNPEKVNYER